MKQKYLIIDLQYCFDCNDCFMACKDEYCMNNWLPYSAEQPRHGHRWIDIVKKERGQYPRVEVAYRPTPCQHCENAPCVKMFPDQVYRRDDGIVIIDPIKSKGNREMVDSCPFECIYYNEELDIPQKCTMCVHLMETGQAPGIPRCAHSCPTDCITYVECEPEEMEQIIKAQDLQVIDESLKDLKPHVFYRHLDKFTKFFIAAEVVKDDECAEGIEVTLKGDGVDEKQTTDCFGEFKFDGLVAGKYSILIDGKTVKEVEIDDSLNAGEIFL